MFTHLKITVLEKRLCMRKIIGYDSAGSSWQKNKMLQIDYCKYSLSFIAGVYELKLYHALVINPFL
jgi:hypothetical protein